MAKKYKYVVQAQYQYEIEIDADNLFEAAKIAIDKLQELITKDPEWKEQRGTDLSMRIWHQYP